MYHIKNDKRCQASVQLIYNSIVILLSHKKFEDITITDIQSISTVSRATFYRHFDNIIDVLAMKCDMEFKKFYTSYIDSIKDMDLATLELSYFIKYYLEYWSANIEIIEVLINIHRSDIIFQSLKSNSEILIKFLSPIIQINFVEYDYFIALRCGLLISLWKTWIHEGKKKTTDELINILKNSFSKNLI